MKTCLASALVAIVFSATSLLAQEAPPPAGAPPAKTEKATPSQEELFARFKDTLAKTEKATPSQEELFARFKDTLSDATLVGHFTVLGQDEQKLRREEYVISSVQKLDEGDYWLFKARIKYGDTDRTLPMPLQVKWAGNTPVITLDELTIPGLGTFDARVVIHDNQYVGTWRHGDKGGQLFGVIEYRNAAEESKPEPPPSEKKEP